MKVPALCFSLTVLAILLAGRLMAETEFQPSILPVATPSNTGPQGSGGGVAVTLQVPTYEFTVPSHLQTVTLTGEATTVSPWFPATFVLHNGASKDIDLHWLGEPRVIFTLSNAAGEKIWTNAPPGVDSAADACPPTAPPADTPPAAAIAGSIAKGGQLREPGKIPLTDNGAPLPPGTYALSATLNADKAFSTQISIEVAIMEVARVDTGVAGSVRRVNSDGSTTGVKASLQLMEVLPAGSDRTPNSRAGASDQSGKFSLIGVFAGTYRLSVTAATSTPGQGASDTTTITVVDGQILDVGALRLTNVPLASTGAVGSVVMAPAGPGTASMGTPAFLSFVEVVPPGVMRGTYVRSGNTDAEGHFKISGFFPGTYRVTAFPLAGTVGLAASDMQTVMIEVGRFNEVGTLKLRTVELPPTGIDGIAIALDSAGKETLIPGATVQLLETDAPGTREANRYTGVTGSGGRFVLGMLPGNYAITVVKTLPGTGALPSTVHMGSGSVTVTSNSRSPARITLSPKKAK